MHTCQDASGSCGCLASYHPQYSVVRYWGSTEIQCITMFIDNHLDSIGIHELRAVPNRICQGGNLGWQGLKRHLSATGDEIH